MQKFKEDVNGVTIILYCTISGDHGSRTQYDNGSGSAVASLDQPIARSS